MADKSIVQGNIDMKELLTPIQEKIIDLLKKAGPMTREEICESFGYKKYHQSQVFHHKRTTIYDNLLKLQRRKVVEKFTHNNGKKGRSVVLWKLNKEG